MIKGKQKGVSLIITFFIMIIVLSVVLSISALLYSEVRVMRNISDSMVSIFAADSGIEKVLYYDRQVVSASAKRGLCSMLDSCIKKESTGDSSIFCDQIVDKDCNGVTVAPGSDCDVNSCKDCSISFKTILNENDNKIYCTTAKVYPVVCETTANCVVGQTCVSGLCTGDSNFEITSKGVFGGAQRQVQIIITPKF